MCALVIVNVQQSVGVFKTNRFNGFVGGDVFYCAVEDGVCWVIAHFLGFIFKRAKVLICMQRGNGLLSTRGSKPVKR